MKTVKESNIWSTFFHALDEKAENMGQRKKKKKGGLLFCLDGVGWSHIIAGDVTALSSGQGARKPPVPFSAQMKR